MQLKQLLTLAALTTSMTTFTWAAETVTDNDAGSPIEGLSLNPQVDRPSEVSEPLYLQVGGNPADKILEAPTTSPRTYEGVQGPPARLRSFELPPIEVVGEARPELKEEEKVGDYQQPRWTAVRRFPGTRIYVLPAETAEFEFWLRPTVPRNGKTELRTLFEMEIGLPNRFQLDLYLRLESETSGPTAVGQSVELRYAFADWNKIWGNPTLYAEWTRSEDEPDEIEFKLLLGGEIAPKWHWGLNLSDELQTGGDRGNEIEITGGVSYTLADSRFSVGIETEDGVVDTHGNRGTYTEKFFFVGPSIQYRPTEQIHIDVAAMPGVSGDSPGFRAYLIVGYEF